jgi:hypothetical protein
VNTDYIEMLTFPLKHARTGCKHEKSYSRENGIRKPATRKPEAPTVATLVLVSDRIEHECQSRSYNLRAQNDGKKNLPEKFQISVVSSRMNK